MNKSNALSSRSFEAWLEYITTPAVAEPVETLNFVDSLENITKNTETIDDLKVLETKKFADTLTEVIIFPDEQTGELQISPLVDENTNVVVQNIQPITIIQEPNLQDSTFDETLFLIETEESSSSSETLLQSAINKEEVILIDDSKQNTVEIERSAIVSEQIEDRLKAIKSKLTSTQAGINHDSSTARNITIID